MNSKRILTVGIIELLAVNPGRGWSNRLYAPFRKQFMSVMPQVVAVWCRQLGHRVFYATHYGQGDPKDLLPNDLDIVFVSTCTPASALAYALAKLYRREGTLTVLGGPHAKSFPSDSLRFFDLVVGECDRPLVKGILDGHFDPPAVLNSDRPLTELPTIEERMPEIATASFSHGKPARLSAVPLLSSVGCPYSCNFCIDWNRKHVAMPERLATDLQYMSRHYPRVPLAYHDPNFAVRFDETMDIIEAIPKERRNPYIMESSLSILKESRLPRLRRTKCIYVAPGIESWGDYSNKAGVGAQRGRVKLAQVVDHFAALRRFVDGIQANFIFGTDVDRGREPVELTIEFMRRLPFVWPNINIPKPYGATPFYEKHLTEGRILTAMPFAFYFEPYLALMPRHYEPLDYYDHLIDIYETAASSRMLFCRILDKSRPVMRLHHGLRTLGLRWELTELRRIRRILATDRAFRVFHEGRTNVLPEFYHRQFERRLGRYAELISRRERIPLHTQQAANTAATFTSVERAAA